MKTGNMIGAMVAAAAALLFVVATSPLRSDNDDTRRMAKFERLVGQRAQAIVAIRYVLKLHAEDGEGEEEKVEIPGVMIDPRGLVLCTNSELGGGTYYRDIGYRVTTSNIRVFIGDDTEGRNAKLVARDTELDLV